MVVSVLPRRRQFLKYFVLLLAIFVVIKLYFRSETPSEEPGLPILVRQRGNDHYFIANVQLNSETFEREPLDWERQKKTISTAAQVTFGKLNVHVWGEICGNDLKSLKNHPLFPNFPSRRFYTKTTRFTHAVGNHDYGERIFGFILPKSTGVHRFWVLHGGSVEVWIGESAEPVSAKLLYERSIKSPSRSSIAKFDIKFTANNKYYFEILHKKGREDHDFRLTWKTPGRSNYVEISGTDMSVKLMDEYLRNGEVDSNEPNLEDPVIHRKHRFPVLSDREQARNDLFNIPLIKQNALENVLPSCEYRPSYIVDHTLTNYRGVWETHYTSLYPVDKTNVTRGGWVCLGNDALDENEAVHTVEDYMQSLNRKTTGRYKLKQILTVEKNHDPVRGDRYLLELEIEDILNPGETYRLSEYVYKEKGKSALCSPQAYHWDRNATVNIVLTVGGHQGRWVQHFINNLAEIYRRTKDDQLNVIIMNFHSKDINIEEALKQSGLPRYILLHMKSKFHKTIGLQYAMNIVTNPNDIVFVCDLHLYLPVTIVDQIRKHCIQGKTAFNPLLVRLDCGYTASNPNGRWEHDGFGPIATFKSDWDRLKTFQFVVAAKLMQIPVRLTCAVTTSLYRFGGMNVERFKHSWGGEDWEMVDRILSARYEIERLKILNFFHFYHTKKGMWKESEQ